MKMAPHVRASQRSNKIGIVIALFILAFAVWILYSTLPGARLHELPEPVELQNRFGKKRTGSAAIGGRECVRGYHFLSYRNDRLPAIAACHSGMAAPAAA